MNTRLGRRSCENAGNAASKVPSTRIVRSLINSGCPHHESEAISAFEMRSVGLMDGQGVFMVDFAVHSVVLQHHARPAGHALHLDRQEPAFDFQITVSGRT